MGDRSRERSRFEVDLDRSRGPRAFRDEHNLWRDDIRRVYRLVRRHIEDLDRERERRGSDPEKPPYLSIAAFGPSGSGKSSLLRTLADDVGRQRGGILRKLGLGKRVCSLPVMDPTTWSETDQFLYAFLAAALEEEQKYQEKQEQGFPQGLSPVQLAFQEVNEYLRVVDDIGAPEELDPLGMSLQKLERHTSGLRLHKALDKFIKELSKTFGADVVLLPVDDLDMTPTHLVQSLQTYQSFLMHPQLVPVFTFTDRMPEELIETHYEQRLRGGRRRAEREDRLSISEQLAVQFLTRCFPVRNRIRLGPAPARVQRAIFNFRPERKKTTKGEGQQPKPEQLPVLELLVISSFLLFGYPDEEDAHKVRAALRPSTLRRQFQVVDAMTDCRVPVFRVPQLVRMANSKIEWKKLERLATGVAPGKESKEAEGHWKDWPEPKDDHRLGKLWSINHAFLEGSRRYQTLNRELGDLGIGATWTTVFNGATWSLLNVHRDTLRELGLFLEDLYSWSPKELRSVVVGRILEQDRAVRRTVVDRWFNRTDYRRSQVLSLLAANIFRPWMTGEEPYGDEEIALREQLRLETEQPEEEKDAETAFLDRALVEKPEPDQILRRLTFPATEGLLWFINVTLGFYLPQIMARNWSDALSRDEPVKERIGGNGWDLLHGPINAMRVADAKQEIFSFGMIFLGPRGYRHALDAFRFDKDSAEGRAWRGDASPRGHLLLRIWSCFGYSRSRFWAAFSLWRGLGFIGQVLELGRKERRCFEEGRPQDDESLRLKFERLIRSHCVEGLVPGSLLDRDANDERLLQGFPRWEPYRQTLEDEITELAKDLIRWLVRCWHDRIFPLPAGDVWIGWGDCFIRRVHGEYILGSLWPRLNATYLEECARRPDCQMLARRRAYREERVEEAIEHCSDTRRDNLEYEERFRWTASVAAGAWTDILLEYWRGCPPVLRLLLTCPVFLKSQGRFGRPPDDAFEPKELFEKLKAGSCAGLRGEALSRYNWFQWLSVPQKVWEELTKLWSNDDDEHEIPGLVPSEFCVERVRVEFFASRPAQRHSIAVERLELAVEGTGEDRKVHPKHTVETVPVEYPEKPEERQPRKPEPKKSRPTKPKPKPRGR